MSMEEMDMSQLGECGHRVEGFTGCGGCLGALEREVGVRREKSQPTAVLGHS